MRWSVIAWVFIEMLSIRSAKAKKQIENTSIGTEGLIPISNVDMPSMTKAAASGILLSYRDTSQPEIGNPIIEVIGMKSRIVPSSASLKPKFVLMVGIRDAQLANANPERKKNTLRKRRCFLRSLMLNFWEANICGLAVTIKGFVINISVREVTATNYQ